MAKINPKSRSTPRPRVAPATAPTATPSTPAVTAAADVAADSTRKLARAVSSSRAPMAKGINTDLVSQLNAIDFKKMIGGPLQAAVDAQVASALATVNFINEVGFTKAEGSEEKELIMVDFTHERSDVNDEGEEVKKKVYVKVPLIAMLPVPSLRIEHVIIDFNAKLNSVESSKVSEDIGVNAELKVGWGPVNFKVSASYQRKSVTGVEVKKEFALNVNVKAVQDEMPAGLERILGMLSA
ncbi:DUF2589 domain-containing protein [Chitinophaga pollutisoli]|uniref:DUF2589 domain-containing protein n=1 Tax=Chitinophaga pollutisoli TaxID=3133966 RepID=A0ABZ2YPG9_9BACT